MYQLTEEGAKYLKEGLPEKKLIELLRDGAKPMSEIMQLPYAKIAISWAQKSEWVKIENGSMLLTENGRAAIGTTTDTEKTLQEINNTKLPSNYEIAKVLNSRNIIENVKAGGNITTEVVQKKGWLERLGLRKPKVIELSTEKSEVDIVQPVPTGQIAQLTSDMIIYGKWKGQKFRKYDVNTPVPKVFAAKKQPYMQFIENMRRKLIGLGFQEMKGSYVESSFWNSDALFMPQDHPARSIHDAFYLKHPKSGSLPDENVVAKVKATQEGGWITGSTGWGGEWSKEEAAKLMLRSQTTCLSARKLVEHGDKPGMFFSIDKVFRYDVIDATHLVEFDQCEGIIIGENLTFRHLLGVLKRFADMVGAEDVRYKPGYFPYTEPSCELFMKFPKLGWVEVGGAGMFRPEVLRPLGIEKSNVLAWGLGLGRLAMMKLGIHDIRQLYSDDIDFLRNTPVVRD
ncbi:MAG: phenylalanine--tRNA ligase subunit alpha [Candidatus Aenigmarchaeota archaeon]|nr:phenylalanine--tRNA ligase subunit alpha [Candidatus Aenigmarchaeota archaeon]